MSASKLGENLNDEHLLSELDKLKERFPKLDEEYLLNVLKDKKGHVGKATQEIFKAGGEGVQAAEEEFYKKYPGAFQDRLLRPESCHMYYLWNINYDGSFNRNRQTKILHDKDGKEVELVQQDSFLWDTSDPRYNNYEYFADLAREGDSAYNDGEWGWT